MAGYNHGESLSLKAASAIAAYVPVSFLQGGSALDETVIRTGSTNEFAVGFTGATIATYGMPVNVILSGRAKGIAGASLGAGAVLGVGSTNGILIPIGPSGLPAHVASGGAVDARFTVGRALKNAAAGDIFDVYVDTDQII